MRKIKSEENARTGHEEVRAMAGALDKSGRLQITSKYGVSHWIEDELKFWLLILRRTVGNNALRGFRILGRSYRK